MYLPKGKSINTNEEKIIFCWHLEGHCRKEQDTDPDPDLLVNGMDPRDTDPDPH
jgi:hypothetical protein